MKRNKLILFKLSFLISFAFFFSSCTSLTKVSLLNSKGLKKVYVDGYKSLESEKENSTIHLFIPNSEIKNGNRLRLFLTIYNTSDESFNFNPDSIRVLRKSRKDSIHVFSYDELIKEVKKARKKYAVISGVGLVLGAMNAGISNSHGSVTSSNGRHYSYSSRNYNSTLASIEIDRQANNRRRDLASYDKEASGLKNNILKVNTVQSKGHVSGIVVVGTPELEDLGQDYFKLIIPFAGEKHSFFMKQKIID